MFKFSNSSVENYKIHYLSKPILPWANNRTALSTKRYIFLVSVMQITTERHESLAEDDWPLGFCVGYFVYWLQLAYPIKMGSSSSGEKTSNLFFIKTY